MELVEKDCAFIYKRATVEDIDELVRTRVIVLRAANKLSDDEDMSIVEQESYAYYKRALETGEHIAYLVYDADKFIGAGGVSFYQVMPTYHNTTGKKAYIIGTCFAEPYNRMHRKMKVSDKIYYEYVYCTGLPQTGNCISYIRHTGKRC